MKKRRILSALLAAVTAATTLVGAASVATAAESPYKDVSTKRWSFDEIMYATENGYMNGKGGGLFAPEETMTRAMVVSVLYRFQGEPTVKYQAKFSDVREKDWFADAVLWAESNNIVNGVEAGRFAPNEDVTRQQLAAILMRYAPMEYIKDDSRKDIAGYKDYKKVQAYAKDAMSWANATGLITGVTTTTLEPAKGATREQFAVILKRFKEGANFEYEYVYNAPVYSTALDRSVELVTDADIYVAVDGNDANPGTLDKPIATFARAKEMVRELKKTATSEIVVAFKAGNYGAMDCLEFTAEDSGTADVPIRYTAYGDGEVTFSNGVTIKNEEFKPIEESDKYLFEEKFYDKIYKVDLNGRVDEFSEKNTLFSGSGACYEARYPNKNADGSSRFYSNMTTTVDPYCSIELQGLLPKIVAGFRTTEGMKITGHLRTGWLVETFNVKSYDPETNVVTFDTYLGYRPGNGYVIGEELGGFDFMFEGRTSDTVFFSNLSDQLDESGEYWFDPSTKMLYVYAPNGDYAIADGGGFMTLNDADYISFVGLGFDGCLGDAIRAENSSHLTLDRLKLSNISGKYAIHESYCYAFKLINSELYNFGQYGLYADVRRKSERYKLETSEFVVDNNYFHDFGFMDSWASGIEMCNAYDAKITHNVFRNGDHGALRFDSCIDIEVEYNIFDRLMTTTADFAAVYAQWGGYVYRSNHVRYNIFMNIRVAAGQYGVYADGSCGQEITNNLFYNSGDHAVTLNGGRDNIVADNIIIGVNDHRGDFLLYGTIAYIGMHESDPTLTFAQWDENEGYGLLSNLSRIPQEGDEWYEEWHRRWPELYGYYNYDADKLGDIDCYMTTVNYIRNNTTIGVGICGDRHSYDRFCVGDETNVEYPADHKLGFVDPTHGDYTPTAGSGIDIPVAEIGLRG